MTEVEEQLEAIIRRAARQTRKERLKGTAVMAVLMFVLVGLGGVLGAWLARPPVGQASAHQPDPGSLSGGAYRPPGKAWPSSLTEG